MPSLDLDLVRHALRTAQNRGYREVEMALGEDYFHGVLSVARSLAETSEPKHDEVDSGPDLPLQVITSPLVGYYREGRTPLSAGTRVARGDHVGVIVALGLANDVESMVEGEVVEVLVKPGQAVQYGQELARVAQR